MFDGLDFSWLDEDIDKMKGGGFILRFCLFILRKKKLKYRELYMLLVGINRRKLGEQKAKEMALYRTLKVYKENHNDKLPIGIEEKIDKNGR